MRMLPFLVALCLSALPASAEQSPPSDAQGPILYASAADVAALVEKARTGLKPGQPAAGDWIVKVDSATSTLGAVFPEGHLHLDYLVDVIPNAALVHERRAELFYVLDGSGVFLTGGALIDEVRMNEETRRGSGVEGGTPRRLSKGDVFILPKGTPHFINEVDAPFVFMSLMLPYGDSER
jgi:mannose-6-phosphate isomerase-like protein (cupin superfamily)